ncbi:MAG: DUF2079 domain-containing protein [Bacteroidales bacterium]|nr:DUF2079 domain-containing protein [Bacteroidales bacterium]
MLKLFNKHRGLFIALFAFGILYALISLVNHYNFRTYALDLGAYTNALYDYAHFQWNDSMVFKIIPENLLADHFDLYLIIFSPLIWIFGSWTLLVVQILFLLAGGIGVYLFLKLDDKTESLAVFGSLVFLGFFGVFSALAFDYHSNVVASCLVPWYLFFLRKQSWVFAALLLFFIWVGKENMALWFGFVNLGFLIKFYKYHLIRRFLWIATTTSFVFFFFVVMIIMPSISNNGEYPHFHYEILGSGFSDAIIFLVSHPIEAIKLLFINHSGDFANDFVKMELWILLALSGLPILLKKPFWLIMLIPIFAQKFYHNDVSMWSFAGQYSIEFAPILAIGLIDVISSISTHKARNWSAYLLVFFVFGASFRVMDNTVYYFDKSRIRIYKSSHYKREYDVNEVHRILKQIPKDAAVSAQSPFLPHLALRDKIYQFPTVLDADYIIFSESENTYPMKTEDFQFEVQFLLMSEDWEAIVEKDITILKRKGL